MAPKRTAPTLRKKSFGAESEISTSGLTGGLDAYTPLPLRVVGVGASAGGLDAFRQLLENLADDTGMAFVFVQHLAQDQKSMLAEILSRSTRMAVIEVTGDTPVVPNRVYVIPPFADMSIKRGVLRLDKRKSGRHLPVDRMFISLANELGSDAVGVILSGADSDGTEGASAIKAAGGITFAQDASALFDGMPNSAAARGVIDFRLAPEAIGKRLSVLTTDPVVSKRDEAQTGDFEKILGLLLAGERVDLVKYKTPTIQRRIERRMNLSEHSDLTSYRRLLEEDPAEREALYRDVLIGVTRFFREPAKMGFLKKKVFPLLLKERKSDDVLRVWVPGCSTGEEAYSIAIGIAEFLEEKSLNCAVQVFATDVNEESIAYARAGRYGPAIERDVSEERLKGFFIKERSGYSVSKAIRGMCVFAQHDLLTNPPFSRMDIISCNNVLIYLQEPQQKRTIATFRYALKQGGFLVLGSSETVGNDAGGFTPVDRKHRIYRVAAGSRPHSELTLRQMAFRPGMTGETQAARVTERSEADDFSRRTDEALLARFSPPCIVVNDASEVVEWRGDIQRFLSLAPGAPSLKLSGLVPPSVLPEINMAISAARKSHGSVRSEPVSLKIGKETISLSIEVLPMALGGSTRSFIVVFKEAISPINEAKAVRGKRARLGPSSALQKELTNTREYLRQLTDRHELADRDARNASEELQSANEELQSTIEELETAKEELQSTNEELTTLNDELRARNIDLVYLGDDLMNLLGGIDTPVVMVDRDLTVRRFNPTAQRLLNLLGTDLGRPISAFQPLLDIAEFSDTIQQVMDTGAVVEKDVRDRLDHWYSLRMRPYRTARNEINGVVITLVDVHELRTLLERAEVARHAAEEARGAAERARVEALEANRLKDEFLSTLSHELRTPITSILGWAQMMRMTGHDKDTVTIGVESIERATKAQIRLIDDLLDISRITTGRLRLEQGAVELGPLMDETLDVIRPAADAKQIQVTVENGLRGDLVRADADRMRQVLWNLLINAVKFTPEGGAITVTIDRDSSRVRLSVRDTGAGIDRNFLPFVFERFSQGETGTRRLRSGLGLGLAITKYLVELHGGTIAAKSDGAGKGSTFTMTLPLYSGDSASAPTDGNPLNIPPAFPSLDGVRVLIVDDDVDTRNFVSTFLKQCGADVSVASSAAEGLIEIRHMKPHLLLSDIAMPGEDGFDFLKSVRGLAGPQKETPVIALTAYTSTEDRDRILAAGFTKYISKPAALADLASCIVEVLESARARPAHLRQQP